MARLLPCGKWVSLVGVGGSPAQSVGCRGGGGAHRQGTGHQACRNKKTCSGQPPGPYSAGFCPRLSVLLGMERGVPTWAVPVSTPSASATSVFAALPSGLPRAPWLTLTPGASLGSPGDWQAQSLSCPSLPAP